MKQESLGDKMLSVERLSECQLPLRVRRFIAATPGQLSPEQLEQNPEALNKDARISLMLETESIFRIVAYIDLETGREHVAVIKGVGDGKDVPIRIHSACLTAETFHTPICDCEEQMSASISLINDSDTGGIIWLNQEGMGNGLAAKLAQIDSEFRTGSYEPAIYHGEVFIDRRDYKVAADILKDLGISSVRLITNNPSKIAEIEQAGIEVTGRIPCVIDALSQNAYSYIDVRRQQGYLE